MFGTQKNLAKVAPVGRGDDFFRDMRSLMDQMLSGWDSGLTVGLPSVVGEKFPAGVSFAPRFEVHETENAVELSAELPGLEEKDVDISVTKDMLTVQGEKRLETKKEEKGTLYTERSYGKFYRSLPLKWDVDRERVEATFKNGVLNINLPKTAAAKNEVRKVSIRSN